MVTFRSTCLETGAGYTLPFRELEHASIRLNALVRSHFWRPFRPRVWEICDAHGAVLQEVRIGHAIGPAGIKIANASETL